MRFSKRPPVDAQAVEDASGAVLYARDLNAQGRKGMIFGPLDTVSYTHLTLPTILLV